MRDRLVLSGQVTLVLSVVACTIAVISGNWQFAVLGTLGGAIGTFGFDLVWWLGRPKRG